MDENFMALDGLDPDIREQLALEAANRGVALEDYVAEVLQALAEGADAEAPPPPPSETEDAMQAPFSMRHRLEAIERRFASAMGGLGSEVRALDSAFAGLSARIDDAGALAEDTAETVNVALQEIRASVAALRKRVGDAERDADAYEQSSDSAYRALDLRLSTAESLAHSAHAAADSLADAHQSLKLAVAEDFRDLADDTADRLAVGLAEARAAADAAAQRADHAFAQVMRDLRASREAVEAQMAESAEQSRQRVQSAVRDLSGRIDTIALRVAENAQNSTHAVTELALRVDDVARVAEASVHAAAAVWSQDVAALRGDVSELREAHQTNLSRMKLTDDAIGNIVGEISALSDALDRRLSKSQTRHDQALADMQARLSNLDSRAAQTAQETAHLKRTLSSDIERVEACTLAALEKLSGDITAGRDLMHKQLAEAAARHGADIDATRAQAGDLAARMRVLDTAVAALREQDHPLESRLSAIEAERAGLSHLSERLARLEEDAAVRAEADKTMLALRRSVGALAARVETQHIAAESLRQFEARMSGHEAEARETADRMDHLADVLSRFTEQSTHAATQAAERLQRLEGSVLDWESKATWAGDEQIAAIQQRLLSMEDRQNEAVALLREQIADFMRSNERRLTVLETIAEANVLKDDRDVSAELAVFRTTVEERIVGLETRSVRALEQIGDTIALLEKRSELREEQALSA